MTEGNLDESRSIASKLKDLSEAYLDNMIINNVFTLYNAILLKESTNVRDRIKAQDLLLDLVNKFGFDKRRKVLTMKHLCDTYVDEIKLSGHEQALYKAQNIIEQLGILASNQNSMRVLVESFLLRARMKLIVGEFDEAETIYSQAEAICEQKGLMALGKLVYNSKTKFEYDLTQMQKLTTSNATLQERLKQANLYDYLKEALYITRK